MEERNERGQFEAGHKGGPGRPKGAGRVEECQTWAKEKGWQKLFHGADGYRAIIHPDRPKEIVYERVDDATWKECVKLALAYAAGKPAARLEIGGEPNSIRELFLGLASPGASGTLPPPRLGGPGVVPAGSPESKPVGDGD